MRIQETLQSAYDYMPPAQKIVKSALTVATATVALEALSNLSGAQAGPVTYALCIAACTTAAPPAIAACFAACSIGLGPWCV